MTFRGLFSIAAVLSLAGLGCSSTPSFPDYGIDAGIECDESRPCEAGEVCVQGRCYEECSSSLPCGPGETCMDGVCTGFGGDAGRDGGRDAPAADTPPDPCDTATCMAPTPYCIAGTCVECQNRDDCPPTATICDVSRGTCVAFDAANVLCAPCNRDLDCAAGFACAMLGLEQVCLPTDTTACPGGMVPNGGTPNLCVPVVDQACRTYRFARAMTACTEAASCFPLGADIDPSACPAGLCRYQCGTPTDCPPELPTCDSGTGYCTP